MHGASCSSNAPINMASLVKAMHKKLITIHATTRHRITAS